MVKDLVVLKFKTTYWNEGHRHGENIKGIPYS